MRRTLSIGLATALLAMGFALANAAEPASGPATKPAPTPTTFTEGVDYERLNIVPAPLPTARIEVMEFFSYGCIHCFHFEPLVDAWLKTKPSYVDLVLVPATFRPDFALFARGYYAAQALGVADTLHAKVWDALWVQHREVTDIAQLADLYASLGVDRTKFIDACADPAIEPKLTAVGTLMQQYDVRGTPDLIVARKYRVLLGKMPDATQAFAVVDFLIARERTTRAVTVAALRH